MGDGDDTGQHDTTFLLTHPSLTHDGVTVSRCITDVTRKGRRKDIDDFVWSITQTSKVIPSCKTSLQREGKKITEVEQLEKRKYLIKSEKVIFLLVKTEK